jgi:phage baseplate assembly protein W
MDFEITPSGDLVLEDKTRGKQLEVTFRVSKFPGLGISFHILNEKAPIENKGLKFTFDVTKDSELSQNVKVIRDVEEKIQLIQIALMTELGELVNNPGVGTLLKLYKHKDIHSETNLNNIKATVLKAVQNVLDEPSVRVVPQNGAGNLYFHNVSIYIYESKAQIFKFYI